MGRSSEGNIRNVEEYRLRNNLPSKMVLNVGTLEPRKNVVALIRAFKKLKGLKRAKLFSWEETAKKILQIYDEVLSKNNY